MPGRARTIQSRSSRPMSTEYGRMAGFRRQYFLARVPLSACASRLPRSGSSMRPEGRGETPSIGEVDAGEGAQFAGLCVRAVFSTR